MKRILIALLFVALAGAFVPSADACHRKPLRKGIAKLLHRGC